MTGEGRGEGWRERGGGRDGGGGSFKHVQSNFAENVRSPLFSFLYSYSVCLVKKVTRGRIPSESHLSSSLED